MSATDTTSAPEDLRIEVSRCVAAVSQSVEDVFAAVKQLGDQLGTLWRNGTTTGCSIDEIDVAVLQPQIMERLDTMPSFDSAGFVFADSVLPSRARHLDWWSRMADGSYAPLILDLDPTSLNGYDYYQKDWFQAALDDQTRAVSGPLIDLPCSSVYILTFTSPVIVDGQLVAVAGADVALSRFENRIVSRLTEVGAPCVLVNRDRRIIAANDPLWLSGERLAERPAVDWRWSYVHELAPDIGWILAAAAR